MTRSAAIAAGSAAAAFVFLTLAGSAGRLSAPAAAVGESRPAAIRFALTVADQPAACGRPLGRLGTSGTTARLRDARLYVHDVSLIDRSGVAVPVALTTSEWQYAGVVLLDFESGCGGGTEAVNDSVLGTVPPGDYTGLRFTVGVPVAGRADDGRTVALNHSSTETTPAPLDLAAMGWSWQAGRKFMKIELDPEGGVARPNGGRAATWLLHLGSTGCTGNPLSGETVSCHRPNRFVVTVERFDPARERVALDLAAMLEDIDLSADRGGAVGCMGSPADPECRPLLAGLGLDDNGMPVLDAVAGAPVFRVIAAP